MRPAPEGRLSLLAIKRRWAARDYQEVVNYSFVSRREDERFGSGEPPARRCSIPIAENLDVMRTTLWSGLLATLVHNVNRKADRVRLFELGRAYLRAPGAARRAACRGGRRAAAAPRRARLRAGTGGAVGSAHAGRSISSTSRATWWRRMHEADLQFQPAEHPALHPGQSARIVSAAGAPLGWIGVLHPRLASVAGPAEAGGALRDSTWNRLLQRQIPAPQPTSKYPPAIRDLAIIVQDHVLAGDLLTQITQLR